MGIRGDDSGVIEELLKGFVAVLAAKVDLGGGHRQDPQDPGMPVGQLAVFEVGTVQIGPADQEVVAGRAREPGLADRHAVL